MRGRYGLLLGAVLLALLCAACGPAEGEAEENGYLLYFREKDLTASSGGDVFQTEAVEIEEGLDTQTAVENLVKHLLAGSVPRGASCCGERCPPAPRCCRPGWRAAGRWWTSPRLTAPSPACG